MGPSRPSRVEPGEGDLALTIEREMDKRYPPGPVIVKKASHTSWTGLFGGRPPCPNIADIYQYIFY